MLAVSSPAPTGTAIDMSIGVGLSSEELGPLEIVRAAVLAEEVGFTRVWVSDHFHPWIGARRAENSNDRTRGNARVRTA
jgi:alkanesulfonate monooxygenase SsuD/methylene tetrahydromethanopterin reductase-like flavin-dependent oxidoreductase (luciferase family)